MNQTTTPLKPPFCIEHRTPMIWSETGFTHREDGVEVTVRHVPAWGCEQGDDAALPPGVTDELLSTVRPLVRLAKQAKRSAILRTFDPDR